MVDKIPPRRWTRLGKTKEGGSKTNLGDFRKMKLVNLIVCLAFCLNLGFSGNALAFGRVTKASETASMLKPKSASDKIESAVLSMTIKMMQDTLNNKGIKGLKAELADLALDKVTDPVERELIANGIGILQREGKTFVVCLIGNGWRADLSGDKIKVEPFNSAEERNAFISGGQLTWIAGEYTPAELIDAQQETKDYLTEAGDEGRIFREDNLEKRVARYSATRTSVAWQLPPLDKKAQEALVKRLKVAFDFRKKAIDSITQADIDAMFAAVPNKIPRGGKLTVGGNWKLRPFKSEEEARTKAREFKVKFADVDKRVEIVLFVEDKWMKAISEELQGSNIAVGVQSFHFDPLGNIERQIEDAVKKGAKYAMIGHSMHRNPDPKVLPGVVALTNDAANRIAEAILKDGRLKLWYIIGVNEDPNKSFSEQEGYIKKQIDDGINIGLDGISELQLANIIITAEPTADISTKAGDGWIDPKTRVNFPKVEMLTRLLTEALSKKFANKAAEAVNTGYGATASPETAATLLSHPDIFNILPGGKSLEANDFYGTVVNAIRGKYGPTIPALAEVTKDIGNPKRVNPAIVLDEEDNPSFSYKGKPGSSKWWAVTASSGGFKYPVYDFEATEGKAPRSIYKILAIEESYMEMAKTNPEALLAYRLEQLHEYFEVSGDSKFHRQESEAVKNLIDKYDKMALDMWKQREAVKAKAKLERENRKVVAGLTSANIAKFLDPKLEGMIPNELVDVANDKLQELVESGLLTDGKAFANADDIHILTTRKNKNAVEDDAKVLPAVVKVFLSVLDAAKKMGIYKGEDLSKKSYLEQVRALEIRKEYQPLKYLERAADPYAVLSTSNTYAGAFNMLVYQILNDPMYCAGITIDPTSFQGYIFEVWDSVEDKILRFDGLTERNKLLTYINQPGRYAAVAGYGKPGYKIPTDEPIFMVSVKRIADDGKSQVGDFSPVLMIRGQSGLPAWGEILAPAGTIMSILTYGGDKTRGIVAWRPTNIAQANKIPTSQRKGISIFTGFGFQSHDDGYIGINEDVGAHQTMAPSRETAEKWAQLFFGSPAPAVVQKGASASATLDDVKVAEKTVLVRPDINVEAENGHIKDIERPEARVVEAAKTLKELSDKKAKVVVIFHQGRPKDPNFMDTADEHAAQVSKLIGRPVKVVNDLYGEEAVAAIKALQPGEILFLKPVRAADPANPGKILEENPLFIKNLKPLIDIFVLDGFSVAHRASPSVTGFEGVPAVAGRLMERELNGAYNLLNPPQPQLVVVGGGKVTEKLTEMVSGLESGKVAKVVVGGRLANLALIAAQPEAATATTAEAQYNLAVATVGEATADDLKEFLGEIPRLAQVIVKYKDKIELPTDVAYIEPTIADLKKHLDGLKAQYDVDKLNALNLKGGRYDVKLINGRVPDGFISYVYVDAIIAGKAQTVKIPIKLLNGIGPETAKAYAAVASRTAQPFASAFVIGPLSDSLYPVLHEEMRVVLEAVSKLGFWSDGGGNTGELVEQLGFTPTYRSLAGGALAEYKTGKVLPGVKFLMDNHPDLYGLTRIAGLLPKFMDHITKLAPFLRPHTYDRNDEVVATRKRLDSRFQRNPELKKGEQDPLLQSKGDYAISNIKADIGSVPGHYKPHRVTIRALIDILMIAKTYGFKGVTQFINLTRAVTLLRTGYTIDELVSKDGLYRKSDSEAMMKKVNEFINANKVVDWDTGFTYVVRRHQEALGKIEKEYLGRTLSEKEQEEKQEKIAVVDVYYGGMESVIASLRDAQIDYTEFTKKVVADSMADALNYFTISEEKASPQRLEILSIMDGLTAVSAKNLFDTNAAITKALGLTTDLAEDAKIFDFKVWAAGDDCQLTMKHKRLVEDKFIHLLAWDALWYAADQTSYFKPYGWKQDILVDRLVSGNIQGAGAGYAEVQVLEGETVLVFSGDKSAPGAFTVPILGILRQLIAQGKFPNGVIAEIWDINSHDPSLRAFFDLTNPKDYEDALTLLSSPEEFAIRKVWTAKERWDGKEDIRKVINDIPLISASTERLVLTAGTYVGKDDPTILIRISNNPDERFNMEDVINVFQYPQVTLGFMRGSHVGPLVPGTQPSFFFGKDKPTDFKPEATPHLFDGPPPVTGLVVVGGKPSEARDVFADAPWLPEAIKQGNFVTQMLRRQGAFPPHKIEGPETEYTTAPEVMASVEAEGRAKPGDNMQELQFLKSWLALQSKGISHKLNEAVITVARDVANKKVILISARVLRSDPTLILALQSINEQINQNLNVWASTANIEANAYRFVLVADDPTIKNIEDVEKLFVEIAQATNKGAMANKEMFAKIITQDDMDEGSILDSAALIQQLKRIGITEDLLVAFVGFREWSDGLKAQQGISENTLSVYADAKERNQIAFVANALFGTVELVATKDRQLVKSLADKLELEQEGTAVAVESKEISTNIAKEIESYRQQVRP